MSRLKTSHPLLPKTGRSHSTRQDKTLVHEKTKPKRNDHAVKKLFDAKRQKAYTLLVPKNQAKLNLTKKNRRLKTSRY